MNQTYIPKPIDTTNVELGDELVELASKLIVNAHDRWGRQRIDDGWTYGPRRNDETREHPCLVPYEELPESEKIYDRIMVTEALKATIALGFAIEPRRD
jgi:ryanodine receptor 2